MSDLSNKIMSIICIILTVIALAFAVTACCIAKIDSERVYVKNVGINEEGNVIITFTDDTTSMLPVLQGHDGVDGVDGAPGKDGVDGVGIANIVINENGELVITMTDDTVYNLGVVVDKSSDVVEDNTDDTIDEGGEEVTQ